jgi:hypothetical protein
MVRAHPEEKLSGLTVRSQYSRLQQLQMEGQIRTHALQGVSTKGDDAKLARILFRHIFVTSYSFQNELIDRFLSCLRGFSIGSRIARFEFEYGWIDRCCREWDAIANGKPRHDRQQPGERLGSGL